MTNCTAYLDAKADYNKHVKLIKYNKFRCIALAIISIIDFVWWIFELYLHVVITLEGPTLTVSIDFGAKPIWIAVVMILFNMVWPGVAAFYFGKASLQYYQKWKNYTRYTEYCKIRIKNFELFQENLPRQNFDDLVYG